MATRFARTSNFAQFWLPLPYAGLILRRVRFKNVSLCLGLIFLLSCQAGDDTSSANKASVTKPTATSTSEPLTKSNIPTKRVSASDKVPVRKEPPLPSFTGTTLDGQTLSASGLIGKRRLLFLFNVDSLEAEIAAKAIHDVTGFRSTHNFEILGIATGVELMRAQEFVEKNELDFPILGDAYAMISQKLKMRGRVLFLVVDADGYIVSGIGQVATKDDDATEKLAAELREKLRLPEKKLTDSLLHPIAPDFVTTPLTEGERFDSVSLHGKPVVLVFFLHTCPHCHKALKSLQGLLKAMPEEVRPQLVAISVADRSLEIIRAGLREEGVEDFAPILIDPGSEIGREFGNSGGVPQLYFIDAESRIQHHTAGWDETRDPALAKMAVAKIAGEEVPVVLHSTEYSGDEFCVMCHEPEYETYLLTKHSVAFNSLVKHGDSAKPECVSCHVVGYGERGGFDLENPRTSKNFENVGCESCHGRGGPHISEDFIEDDNYEDVCLSCHDAEHSLGFEYAKFLPHISHEENAHLTKLPLEERRKLLEEHGGRIGGGAAKDIEFVGSDSCQECHEQEYETWSKSPHGHALESLVEESKQNEKKCLACHNTNYLGRNTGIAEGTPASSLANVGCESCHGPGAEHIKEDGERIGNITSLGDKCDSCVILQICGSCHDQENDPGFDFEVQQKIDEQRHGTIEPGTGKPLEKKAALDSHTAAIGILEREFHGLKDRG